MMIELIFIYGIIGVLVAIGLRGAIGVEQPRDYYDE